MKFRVSIMPRNDITGTGGDSNGTGGNTGTLGVLSGSGGNISSSFVASNSKIGSTLGTFNSSKLSPITGILDGGQS